MSRNVVYTTVFFLTALSSKVITRFREMILTLSTVLFAAAVAEEVVAEIPNAVQSEPGSLIEHAAPEMGRLAVIEILGDYVITIPERPSSPANSDFIVRAWDISNPSAPVVVDTFGHTQHPFFAHGTIKRGNELLIFGHPNNTIRLEDDGSLSHVSWSGPDGHHDKSGMMRPWAAESFWSYNDVSGLAWLSLDLSLIHI